LESCKGGLAGWRAGGSMSVFTQKLLIEKESEAIVLPLIQQRGWIFSKHYPAHDRRGDYAITRNGETLNIELKAERNTTGTLFIEEFSNYVPGEYALDGTPRTTLGWFLTLTSDFIIYHFLDTGKIYKVDLKQLQAQAQLVYALGKRKDSKDACDSGQKNRTIGWCVPIAKLPDVFLEALN
jgi:hypothetical protein